MRRVFSIALAVTVLLVAPALRAAVSHSDGWESGITGGTRWRSSHVYSDYGLQRVSDVVRSGAYALRVEVRSGDAASPSAGERAEVLGMLDADGDEILEDGSSGTQFLAFSVRFDPSWQSPGDWGHIIQLHGPDAYGAPPSFGISAENELRVNLLGGDVIPRPAHLSYPLEEAGLGLGHWIDLVVRIKLAGDATGEVDVWRRDEGETEFVQVLALRNVATLQHNGEATIRGHYWKHGFYRNRTDHTNILWLDGLTRATTRAEAEASAFGMISAPPDPDPQPVPPEAIASIAGSANVIASSSAFAVEHELVNLFDGCLAATPDCTAGTDAEESLWVELDLQAPHELTSAHLFGDDVGSWVSAAWTLEHKRSATDAYVIAFADEEARAAAWATVPLAATARFVRVTVRGDAGSGKVQARELALVGAPCTTCGAVDPGPDGDAPGGGLAGAPSDGTAAIVGAGCAAVPTTGPFLFVLALAALRAGRRFLRSKAT